LIFLLNGKVAATGQPAGSLVWTSLEDRSYWIDRP